MSNSEQEPTVLTEEHIPRPVAKAISRELLKNAGTWLFITLGNVWMVYSPETPVYDKLVIVMLLTIIACFVTVNSVFQIFYNKDGDDR